jgi:DNA-binding Lrp family transcriptional regulator
MEDTDRIILNRIQDDFPVVPRPYAVIGEGLGLEEQEVFSRVIALKRKGIIRRIGASFNSNRLGYHSTLVGMSVPTTRLKETAEIIGQFDGVTHCYLRNNKYNLWFTLIAESQGELKSILSKIKSRTGIKKILNLPAIKVFKIRASFKV